MKSCDAGNHVLKVGCEDLIADALILFSWASLAVVGVAARVGVLVLG